jgi:hypothetical protein
LSISRSSGCPARSLRILSFMALSGSRDFEVVNLFGDVNEFFELVDGFNGPGKEFVETFLKAERGSVGEVFAVELIV